VARTRKGCGRNVAAGGSDDLVRASIRDRLPSMRKGLLIVALFCLVGVGADGELWPGLEPGSYPVGFRVVHTVDVTRARGENPTRVIHISIWYPAAGTGRGAEVTWKNYFQSAVNEADLSGSGRAQSRDRHLNEAREAALEAGADASRFDALLDEATLARHDVRPAEGSFPLVIFVPGFGAQPFQNTVACEYLASHGFVVASFPSEGQISREMTHDDAGVEAQVGDIAFAIREVQKLMNTDADHVGVVGYSWGGLTATFAAMQGVDINALVAIDPTLLVRKGHENARGYKGYDPASLSIPFMAMIADAKEWKERDLTFLDELSGIKPVLLRFHDFKHGDFASVILRFLVHTLPGGGEHDVEKIDAGYAAECRYLEAFFDAHLRGGNEGKAFLEGESTTTGVSVER